LIIFLYASLREAFVYNNIFLPPFGSAYLTQTAVLLFTFLELLSVSIAMRKEMDEIAEKEQKMATERAGLERMNSLKTDLMRTVSHELRTPLAVMMGFAQITAEKGRDSGMNEEIINNLDAIAKESERMAGLVNSMRESALAKDNLKDRQEISLKEVIHKTAGLYKKVLERKGVSLRVHIAEDLHPIYCSENEITQVIFNLLRNADKATEFGYVEITAQNDYGLVQVTIKDTGSGIQADDMPHIFDQGFSKSEGGSGVGLPLCKQIIESFGGRIGVESESGKGTRVFFTLPRFNPLLSKEMKENDESGSNLYSDRRR
jgi:signal transduction histidine kinase